MINDYIEKLSKENLDDIPLKGALDLLSMGYQGHCLWKAKQKVEEEKNGPLEANAQFVKAVVKKNEE